MLDILFYLSLGSVIYFSGIPKGLLKLVTKDPESLALKARGKWLRMKRAIGRRDSLAEVKLDRDISEFILQRTSEKYAHLRNLLIEAKLHSGQLNNYNRRNIIEDIIQELERSEVGIIDARRNLKELELLINEIEISHRETPSKLLEPSTVEFIRKQIAIKEGQIDD